MISVNFTDDAIQELNTLRFNHPHPKIQKRCHALWMRSQGFARSEITKVSGLSKTTYTDVVHAYAEKGTGPPHEIKTFRLPRIILKYP